MRRILFFVIPLLLFTGCSSITLDETTNKGAMAYAQKEFNLSDRAFENRLLLKPRVGIYILIKPSYAPANLAETFSNKLAARFEVIKLFPFTTLDPSFKNQLAQQPALKQKADIYFDTLSFVAVSDRDLSNPIGQSLNLDQFFLVQLDHWPQMNGEGQQSLRIKARLVDTKKGNVIWTGIAEEVFAPEDIPEAETKVLVLLDQLTEKMQLRFQRKWHRMRYDGLKGKDVS